MDLLSFHPMPISLILPTVEAAASSALSSLWQGTLLALLLATLLRATPRASASLRFRIWVAGYLSALSLPIIPGLLMTAGSWATHPNFALPTSEAQAGSSAVPLLALDNRWSLAIAALWLTASLYRAIRLLQQGRHLHGLWQRAIPLPERSPQLPIRHRRAVEVCSTTELDRPSVIGFFRPRILIPEWLLPRLSESELQQIILHEEEHLRRGDDWTNLLQKLSLIVFPLNPALFWIEHKLCQERELACDEGVVRQTHAPRDYAACLTNLAECRMQRTSEALALGAVAGRTQLARRVYSVLLRQKALGPVAAGTLTAALGSILLLASVELARCPQLIGFAAPASPHPDQTASINSPESLVTLARTSDIGPSAGPVLERKSVNRGQSVRRIRQSIPALPSDQTAASNSPTAVETAFRATQPTPQFTAQNVVARDVAAQNFGVPTSMAPHRPAQSSALQDPARQDQSSEQWIVLTTWEQVDEVAVAQPGTPQPPSQAEPSQSTRSAIDPGQPLSLPQPGRLRVTQLILRVPPEFRSTFPTAVPTRNGWLVIQL
jgi:beta-lactamase regulating signal transducer with metallopeptidase domain